MSFGNIKPRGYHHRFIYVDERKNFLESLGKKHDTAADDNDVINGYSPRIARPGMFRRKSNEAERLNSAMFRSSLVALFIVLCFVAWLYML